MSGLSPGTHLGPYEITAPLGAGGMGEVYRATDSHLRRSVAIKVLPAAMAADADRLGRFQREAHVLAALNHPNIAAIYGLEKTPDLTALVMELVEGQDLSEIIFGAPSLHLPDALTIARQIADALEAAHEQGIVHRDLKPQNIKVRADGTVKVLDFGLAKAMDPPSPGATAGKLSNAGPWTQDAGPTMTSPAMTAMGMILGTAAYMSPEQARGKAVDRRADIWAFGVVLYEMLTGRRCFPGDEISDVLAAVLRQDIDWTALPSTTPVRLRRLLERCLDRDPKQRLRDIGEARVALAKVEAGGAESAAEATPRAMTSRLPWGITAALAVALVAVTVWLYPKPAPVPTPIQFTLGPPAGTSFNRFPGFISLSADGQHIAFTTGEALDQKLWIRSVGAIEPRPVPAAAGGNQVAWSPDLQSVAFISTVAQGELRRVDLAGGPARTLSKDAAGDRPAWSQAGVILYAHRTTPQRLMRVPEAGGPATPATELNAAAGEGAHSWPVFLPDGNRFIFLARNPDRAKSALFLASLDSMERTHLVDVNSMAELVPGYLLYQRDGTLFAHPFDEGSGRLTGNPMPIVEGIQINEVNGRAAFATSRTGLLVYRTGQSNDKSTLSWLDASGKVVGTIGLPDAYYNGDLSPDGRRYVASVGNSTAGRDLVMIDLARNIASAFTSDTGIEDAPLWTPDGESVVFSSGRKGIFDLYIKNAGGASPERLLYESAENKFASGFSPDGRLLLFHSGSSGARQIWVLPLAGDAKPYRVFPEESESHSGGRFSPDGKWVAYYAGNPSIVFVQPFPPTGYREQISATQGITPVWTADGRQIVFNGPQDSLMLVDVTPVGGKLRVSAPRELFRQAQRTGAFGFTMDGRAERFLLVVPPNQSSGGSEAPLTVIANWTSLVKKK